MTNRMKLSDYFDGLVSDLDLQVELFIIKNIHCQRLVNEVNATRDVYIAEIRACEAYNMSLLIKNNDHELGESQQWTTQPNKPELATAVTVMDENASTELLFKRFCFIIELYKESVGDEQFNWRLFSTDRYLKSGEIISFQEMLKFTVKCGRVNTDLHLARCSLERLFTDVDINPKHFRQFGFLEIDHIFFQSPNWAVSMDVIHAPSAKLFYFNNLLINMNSIGLIRSEARYLFTNVTHLHVFTKTDLFDDRCATAKLRMIKSMIEQFDAPLPALPDKPRLVSIVLEQDTYKFNHQPSDLSVLGPCILNRVEKLSFCLYKFTDYESFLRLFSVFTTSTEDQGTVAQPWTSLTELTVRGSNLSTLDGRLFTLLPNLRSLVLNNNRLDKLAEGTFIHASKLEELDLRQNECWSARFYGPTFFRGVEDSLRVLRVHFSSEADLTSQAGPLGCLNKLEELDISDSSCLTNLLLKNPLTGYELVRLPSLKRLKMAQCSVRFIESGAIEHMAGGCAGDEITFLEMVDLRKNCIKSLCMNKPLQFLF